MKKQMHLFIWVICMFLFSPSLWAQTISIHGRVTSQNDTQPLGGVFVNIVGQTQGQTTNDSGYFSIAIPGIGTKLSFSSAGKLSQTVTVSSNDSLFISLADSTINLNEVVVIGYGTQRKRDVTSSISTINVSDIGDRPIVSPSEAMTGKAAGVQVFQPSGKPGNDMAVRVRGLSSPNGTQPLFVIDGMITADTKSLDPNTIESITVLKDASAAGIYGSLGSTNGVVLITTKKGRKGTSKVDVNVYTGFQKIVKKLDVLNSNQLADLLIDEKRNAGDNTFTIPDSLRNINVNWQDQVYRTAPMTSANVGFSGGSDKGTFYLGGGYLNQQGIIVNNYFKRYSAKMSVDQNMKKWLKVGMNIAYNRTNTRDVTDNSNVNSGGVVLGALQTPQFVDKYNADGTFAMNPFQAWENPWASLYGSQNGTTSNNLLGDIYTEIALPFNLKYRSQFSITLNNSDYNSFTDPFLTQYGRTKEGFGSSTFSETFRWTWDNTLTYDKTINDHHLTIVGGTSNIDQRYTYKYLYGEGFATGSIPTLNAASTNYQISTTRNEWTVASFFGRLNYSFKDRYLLTASFRTDGSSRSGINTRWGRFPTVSAGWRVSDEAFMKDVTAISDFKIRAGYGSTGNLAPDYLTVYPSATPLSPGAKYPFSGAITPGVAPGSQIGNPNLKWESAKQFNAGFDMTLFKALTINVDYYNKRTTDLIFQQQLPSSTGFSYTLLNLPGIVSNKGIEITLSSNVHAGSNFTWNPSFNISFNKNRISGLDSGTMIFNGDVNVIRNGLPLGAFWGYVAQGVDPQTGNMKFKDINNDGVIDPDNDKEYIGNPQPKFTFGFSNSFRYKDWTLDLLIDGVYGNKVYNSTRLMLENMSTVANSSASTLNRWRNPGDITDMPRAVFGDPAPTNSVSNASPSTRFLENGSFLRMRSATLSYRLSDNWMQKIGFNSASFYVTGQNIFIITKYKGYYPEVNSGGNSPTNMGIDYGTYPQARSIILGVNLSF
ncbi:MAG: TonB-dependent receptor [Pseudopedobacter saltans]|uniref:TonB-dependent receptor n=1 Tax=Pseudopedobacter saltans TaxID=151895 RepID=A0A2W5HA39_9SPHI|nr:MAG: TonB-dependent receptor [Pseudopedobacter saltans]